MANIAVLTRAFPPESIGGAQLQAQAWAQHLSACHRVTVVTRREEPQLPLVEERDGYTIRRHAVRVPDLGRIPRFLIPDFVRGRGMKQRMQSLMDMRGTARCINAIDPKPDVLLCFTTLPTGLVGVEVGRRLGIPAVVWIRGESDYRAERWAMRRGISTHVWESAAGVLVQTEKARADFLEELALASAKSVQSVSAKLDTVANGLDVPSPPEFQSDGPILSVGRLVPEKGMDVVIDACAGLDRPLIIAGDGPELPELRRRAANLEADVQFTGFLDRSAVDGLYRKASVVVLASHTEGMPNVVLEAMAHARPVVATPVGSIPDLIEDGVNGLLIPTGDAGALASALDRLEADPGLAESLGLAARATAEQFAWERVMPKFEHALERFLRPRGG